MERLEMNLETGELRIIQLTAQEIVEIEARPQPVPPAPVELTTEQKLEAAGLTVAELKALFGLT
jgi:hypothetical protein